ncbi:MAG: hypothetical protein OCC46_00410 [Pseudodesulfovibrio sp.]
MADKISSVAVVKEGFAMFRSRKKELIGFLISVGVLSLLVEIIVEVFSAPEGSSTLIDPVLIVFQLITQTLISLFVVTVVSHLSISIQRGVGAFVPDKLLGKLWAVFVRCLLIWLVSTLVVLFALMPSAVLSWVLVADWNNPDPMALFLAFIIGLLLTTLAHAFLCRLWIIIPGASVGHKVSLSVALKMTKEQPWAPFLSYLLLFGLLVGFGAVLAVIGWFLTIINVGPGFGLYGFGLFEMVVVLFVIVFTLAELVMFAVAMICNGIWYENLCVHYEAQQASFGTDPNYGQCQD